MSSLGAIARYLWPFGFAAVAAMPMHAEGDSYLIKDGRPQAEIVIGSQPARLTRLAASELQNYLFKISGAKLPISAEPNQGAAIKIYVGRSRHTHARQLSVESLEHGAFRMVAGPDWLALLGADRDYLPREPRAHAKNSGETTRILKEWDAITGDTFGNPYFGLYARHSQTRDFWEYDDRGTLNAVYEFLRSLGVRWFAPGEIGEVVPSTTIVENDLGPNPDPAVVKGNITVSNTGLRPWSADNYDLSLEYYTDSGGLFSAGIFYKSIKDFFGTFATVPNPAGLEAIGLGSEYQGWQVNSTINAGDASIKGAEVSMNQSLRGVGAWGQYFRVFANFTKLETRGAKTADFTGFLPKSANWGVTFTKKPLVVIAKWNYRGLENRGVFATFGPDGYTYFRATTRLDLNLEYYLRPNLALSVSARNVFNVPIVTYREGSQTPDYAKRGQILDFGVPFSVGIKGSF